MLIVEQRARAVLAISDRTYVLGGGEVRMEGTPAELSASPEFVESSVGGRRGCAVTSERSPEPDDRHPLDSRLPLQLDDLTLYVDDALGELVGCALDAQGATG